VFSPKYAGQRLRARSWIETANLPLRCYRKQTVLTSLDDIKTAMENEMAAQVYPIMINTGVAVGEQFAKSSHPVWRHPFNTLPTGACGLTIGRGVSRRPEHSSASE
jgi:hypothetical protein